MEIKKTNPLAQSTSRTPTPEPTQKTDVYNLGLRVFTSSGEPKKVSTDYGCHGTQAPCNTTDSGCYGTHAPCNTTDAGC